jgi:hypothetical protein
MEAFYGREKQGKGIMKITAEYISKQKFPSSVSYLPGISGVTSFLNENVTHVAANMNRVLIIQSYIIQDGFLIKC